MIEIEQVDHLGIRITDEARSLAFYQALGFEVITRVEFDAVTILRNAAGVELNLIRNGVDTTGGKNVLMDVPEKHPGHTHVALRVGSILDTLKGLEAAGIEPSEGPVTFGDGHVSIFVRDPDQTVLELRGRLQEEEEIPGLVSYSPD